MSIKSMLKPNFSAKYEKKLIHKTNFSLDRNRREKTLEEIEETYDEMLKKDPESPVTIWCADIINKHYTLVNQLIKMRKIEFNIVKVTTLIVLIGMVSMFMSFENIILAKILFVITMLFYAIMVGVFYGYMNDPIDSSNTVINFDISTFLVLSAISGVFLLFIPTIPVLITCAVVSSVLHNILYFMHQVVV